MVFRAPRIRWTDPRRAGVIAATAIYPWTRLAGTLPRNAVDRAIVSGVAMGVAYRAASATTSLVHATVARRGSTAQYMRAAALSSGVAIAGAVYVSRARKHAAEEARERRRVPVPQATVTAAVELVTWSTTCAALVSAADAIGWRSTGRLRQPGEPRPSFATTVAVVGVGAGIAVLLRQPQVLRHLEIDPDRDQYSFNWGAPLPIAVSRAAAVAALTSVAVTGELWVAEAIGQVVTRTDPPPTWGVVAGHVVASTVAFAAVSVGISVFASRVALAERVLEAAYAAVPSRRGVSGGPDSAYEFADLGREGRRFVSQAFTADEIERAIGSRAVNPVRAWVPMDGLSGDAVHDAERVVDELDRLGGFDVSLIMVAAPVGSGFVSYVATESVELLTGGDCASVAVPYANVPSALAILRRDEASAAFAHYVRAIAVRAARSPRQPRVVLFGESLGALVALDAFGTGIVDVCDRIGVAGGLYVGVPIYTRVDRAIRPTTPETAVSHGVHYVCDRNEALMATSRHVALVHRTDPVALADLSRLVRHGVDFWGRPTGIHLPLVSFLVHLLDVKNAMNLRPGHFEPSPGHDYRYETAAAVARAYDLDFERAEAVERALRERELAWSVRRLISRASADAAGTVVAKLKSWGVDPSSLPTRFGIEKSPFFDLPDRSTTSLR